MTRASDTAYASIRKFILSGKIEPGTQLTEESLASISGVSRTPVREAIRRLEMELMIVRSDSKRLFVANWSNHELDEMFALRAMMESYAAARAAVNISSKQIDELQQINRSLENGIARILPDISLFLHENRRFHDIILEAAASPRLSTILPMLVDQPVVTKTAHKFRLAELQQSARDHNELIAAFQARDPEWAKAIMTAHIRRAYHAFSKADIRESAKSGLPNIAENKETRHRF